MLLNTHQPWHVAHRPPCQLYLFLSIKMASCSLIFRRSCSSRFTNSPLLGRRIFNSLSGVVSIVSFFSLCLFSLVFLIPGQSLEVPWPIRILATLFSSGQPASTSMILFSSSLMSKRRSSEGAARTEDWRSLLGSEGVLQVFEGESLQFLECRPVSFFFSLFLFSE